MTEQVLEAMIRAEQEADEMLKVCPGHWEGRWARDRLRLIARDRATLERHRDRTTGPTTTHFIEGKRHSITMLRDCWCGNGPNCAERQAVIDYWTEETR